MIISFVKCRFDKYLQLGMVETLFAHFILVFFNALGCVYNCSEEHLLEASKEGSNIKNARK